MRHASLEQQQQHSSHHVLVRRKLNTAVDFLFSQEDRPPRSLSRPWLPSSKGQVRHVCTNVQCIRCTITHQCSCIVKRKSSRLAAPVFRLLFSFGAPVLTTYMQSHTRIPREMRAFNILLYPHFYIGHAASGNWKLGEHLGRQEASARAPIVQCIPKICPNKNKLSKVYWCSDMKLQLQWLQFSLHKIWQQCFLYSPFFAAHKCSMRAIIFIEQNAKFSRVKLRAL